MVSISHLDHLEILNIFRERKQIDFLSVDKWLKLHSNRIFSHFQICKISLPEPCDFFSQYFRKTEHRSESHGEQKPALLTRCPNAPRSHEAAAQEPAASAITAGRLKGRSPRRWDDVGYLMASGQAATQKGTACLGLFFKTAHSYSSYSKVS